eukprot:GGOE01053102.1.p1 GENE.GGOE01053102.1~~GGOE01053102.1.p1  ORF type:complete len:444 (-),score=97.91 GGOE01053102.1:235-1566(-)
MLPSQLLGGLVLVLALILLTIHFFTVTPVALVPRPVLPHPSQEATEWLAMRKPEVARHSAPPPPPPPQQQRTPGPAAASAAAPPSPHTEDDTAGEDEEEATSFVPPTSPPATVGDVPALPSVGNSLYPGVRDVDWLLGTDHLPGTAEAQQLIFDMQNPPRCSERRFFLVGLRDCGFGGVVHGLSFALARAMHKNRTLLVRPPTKWHFAPKGKSNVGLEYYFEPISNCSLPLPGQQTFPGQFQTIRISEGSQKYGLIPHQFRGRPLVYWRAQSSRYILRRPRPWYAQHLASLMQELLPHPVPRPSVCMHVRRSDKRSEAKDTPFAKYIRVAEEFRQRDVRLQHVFLSSEDDAVINETTQYGSWRFHYCKEDRHNWNHDQVAALKGGDYLADISFVNLYLHMECDYLVITRKSNWCRLIEEMRLTGNRSRCPVYNLSPAYAKTWY